MHPEMAENCWRGCKASTQTTFPKQYDNKKWWDCPLYILKGHRWEFSNYDQAFS